MKKLWLLAVMPFLMGASGASPNWKLLGTVQAEPENGKPVNGTWSVYVDPASVKRSGSFVVADLWMKMNRQMCYPSADDCRERISDSFDSYRFFCDGTRRGQAIGHSQMILDLATSQSDQQPPRRKADGKVFTADPRTLVGIGENAVCKMKAQLTDQGPPRRIPPNSDVDRPPPSKDRRTP